MKRRIASVALALCLILSLMPEAVWADETPTNGKWGSNLTWEYDEASKTLTISGSGAMSTETPLQVKELKNQISKVVINEGVTAVGGLGYFRQLTHVVLPTGVTHIEPDAFEQCNALTAINIPDTVRYIGSSSFASTKITEFNVPYGVVEIGGNAFYNCASLRTVTMPITVCKIGNSAFKNCTSLSSVDNLKGAAEIGDGAFYHCTSLTNVQFSSGVKIGQNAFNGCSGLQELTIPSGKVDFEAFNNCTGLTEITVSASVERSFQGCTNLETVNLYSLSLGNGYNFSSCDKLKTINFYGTEWQWKNALSDNDLSYWGINHSIKINKKLAGGEYTSGTTRVRWVYADGSNILEIFISGTEDHQVGENLILKEPPYTQKTAWKNCLQNAPFIEVVPEGTATVESGVFSPGTILHKRYKGLEGTDITVHPVSYLKEFCGSPIYMCCKEGCLTPEIPADIRPHAGIADISKVSPTCVKTGSDYGKKCSDCGEVLVEPLEIPTIDHDWVITSQETEISATCTQEGSETVTLRCTKCNEEKVTTEPIPVTDHTPVDIPDKAPTCGEAGSTGGTECSVCKLELAPPAVVSATGEHTPSTVKHEDIQTSATCTNDGLKTVTYECSVCNQEFEKTETIPKLEHSWSEETSRQEPTCTEVGSETITRTCSVCNKTESETKEILPTGHKEVVIEAVQPTCQDGGWTEGKSCSVCGETLVGREEVEPLGHDFDENSRVVTVITEPTCTTEGSQKFTLTCQRCDETQDSDPVSIPALGHDLRDTGTPTITKEPTCTEVGSETITRTCSVCKETVSEVQEIPATGHKEEVIEAVPPTCLDGGWTEGKRCSVCDETLVEREEVEPLGHDFDENSRVVTVITEPTCTTEGSQKFTLTCQRCNETQDSDPVSIPALDHDWGDTGTTTITKAPTCTEDGSQTIEDATCSRCGASGSFTVPIPATGHKWGEETSEITKPATCTEDGIQTYTKRCTVEGCGEVKTRTEEISATGHTYGEWTTTKEPTATETGTKERVCASCGDKQTETIPATGGDSSEPDTSKVFKITFDTNGGSSGTTLTTGADGKLSALPSNPTRSGYTFEDWYTAKTGGERVTTSMVFEKDTTVYARWTEISSGSTTTKYQIYTPSYTSGGSVYVSHSSAAEGTRITIELRPRSAYEIDWLSVVNLNTGRELSLTRRYDDEYTFIMPDSPVEVAVSFLRQYTDIGYWYVPEQTPVSTKPVGWYYKDGQIWHVTDGLVPSGTLLTRDMLISVLYNMDPSSTGEPLFWATEYKIMPDIYSSGLWGMDKSISREQTAMILYGYSQHMGYNLSPSTNLTGYADYEHMRPIARPAMSWAQAFGLITNTSANRLLPRSHLNCGEANSMLSRFFSTVAWTR